MSTPLRPWSHRVALIAIISAIGLSTPFAPAQTEPGTAQPPSTGEWSSVSPYEGYPVRELLVEGLDRVDQRIVLNHIRTVVGEPLSLERINTYDVPNLTRLNQFRRIGVEARLSGDGGVIVRFIFDEWPLATEVQVVGNRELDDKKLLDAIRIRPGDPLDTYQINLAKKQIAELYQERGFHLIDIVIDSTALEESNAVIFLIREGPRAKITEIEFRGNAAFTSKRLQSRLKTKSAIPFLRTGRLIEEGIQEDVRTLIDYYQDRGFIDVRVDRRIELSNDFKESKVVFLIDEGSLYTLRRVDVHGVTRLKQDQLAALMLIKPGDVYSKDKIERSRTALHEAYGLLGYIDVQVNIRPLRDTEHHVVDLQVQVSEGQCSFTGEVRVIGNTLTKRDVILRETMFRPGRPLSTTAIKETERRLKSTRLFDIDNVRITPQPPDPNHQNPNEPQTRDVVIEVEETDTGSFNFGAAVSSDTGLLGAINLEQRNFDIADYPRSISELTKGRAFRGAGQTFRIDLTPGNEYSNYSVSLIEPYLFGTDNSLSNSMHYTERELESYNETRWGGSFRLGRRLGEVWQLSASTRFQSIDPHNIIPGAPVDVFVVQDEHTLTSLGIGLVRNTMDSMFRPTKGSRLELKAEQIGLLGGDFDFSRLEAEHKIFITLEEDFLGRKNILSMSTKASYQFGGYTPLYERYYLGGRSLRGLDYRTVSPKGIKNNTGLMGNDPVGGDWLFSWGLQYDFPLLEQMLGGVVFLDTGTVIQDPGFDDYRVTIGTGVRLFIPQFGQAPLAFDIAIPLIKESHDETRFFTFMVELPF